MKEDSLFVAPLSANPAAIYKKTDIPGVYLCIDEEIYGDKDVILCFTGVARYVSGEGNFIARVQTELGLVSYVSRRHHPGADLIYYRFLWPRGLFVKPLLT